jgi:hypothetical protein
MFRRLMDDIKVGDTIAAGTLLLFTLGLRSDFCVNGIYRAKKDFVVPGKREAYGDDQVPDLHTISADAELVEAVPYCEVWGGDF